MTQPGPWITVYVPLASTAVVTVATVLLAWFTARYVRLTGRLVDESRHLRDPFVTVDFEVPDHQLNMTIQNYGLTPARDVRFELIRDTDWIRGFDGGSGLADVAVLQRGVSYLTPGRRLKYALGFPDWREMPDGSIPVSLRVTFSSLDGVRFEHVVEFDFDQLREVLFESFRDPTTQVAAAIRDVESRRRSHESMQEHFSRFAAPTTKRCPMCAEQILHEARKCRYCGEMQEPAGPTTASSGRRARKR